jgi:hypothetical protein
LVSLLPNGSWIEADPFIVKEMDRERLAGAARRAALNPNIPRAGEVAEWSKAHAC